MKADWKPSPPDRDAPFVKTVISECPSCAGATAAMITGSRAAKAMEPPLL